MLVVLAIKMNYDDDELILSTLHDSGSKPETSIEGKVKLRIINKEEAPLQETKLRVLLELTGVVGVSNNDRPGIDIVVVLNVNQNMMWGKLDKIKVAIQFLIKQLTCIDRLSVVTFAGDAARVCALRSMTETSKAEIEKCIDEIMPTITKKTKKSLMLGLVHGSQKTNVTAGLEMALRVLIERRLTIGRVCAVMLISDGSENAGADVRSVQIGNVPVFTFSYCGGSSVLHFIAENSNGGTYSFVDNLNRISRSLSVAFSQCLAGLLTVAVHDLKLRITELDSKIEEISAGSYLKFGDSNNNAGTTVSVSLGDLYDGESRKVLVDLKLPASDNQASTNLLQVTYSYNIMMGKSFESKPQYVTLVSRTARPVMDERDEVIIEVIRLKIVQMVKEARRLADSDQLEDAQDKMYKAQIMLEKLKLSPTVVKMLNYEVFQLLLWMQDMSVYECRGRAFALACETSHDRQRFATRGDVDQLRLFATPCMDLYYKLAKLHEQNNTRPLHKTYDAIMARLKNGS